MREIIVNGLATLVANKNVGQVRKTTRPRLNTNIQILVKPLPIFLLPIIVSECLSKLLVSQVLIKLFIK